MKSTAHKRQLFIAALAASCLLHVVVFTTLFVKHSSQSSSVYPRQQAHPIVNAVAIKQQDVEREVQKIQSQQLREQQARQAEMNRYSKAVALAKKNQQDARRAVAKLNAQQKRISETLKKSKLLAKKSADDMLIRKHKLAKLAKKQREIEKKIKKQKAFQLTKEKQKKMTELKRKKEALGKLAKLRAKAADDALKKQLQQDQSQLANAHAKQVALEVAKYKAKIVAAVGRRWLIPKNADKKLSCQLLIHLGPGGVVLDVSTLKSSGDPLLDRSAKTAVLKASPLPVPDKSELFDSFRELHLTVRPEEIVGSSLG